MKVWLRLLIVWFVAIALPVQGMAGVTMAHCAPSDEGMVAEQVSGRHDEHPDACAAHLHADAAANGPEAADDGIAAHDTAPDPLPSPTHHKCSSCAACCAGSALPSAMLHVPQLAAAPVVFAEGMVSVDDYASDGPDRPPRRHPV